MCIGQSLDGVGTEGGKERKEKLYPGERERERQQRMHVIQLRNGTRMMTDEIRMKLGRGRESLIFHNAQDEHDPRAGAAGGDINRSRVPLPHPTAILPLSLF